MNNFNFDIPKIDFAMQKQYAKIVYDAVDSYVRNAGTPFTYDDICDNLEARFPFMNADDVGEYAELALKVSPLIAKVENASENPLFTPVQVFYKGKSFCIVPFIEDIEEYKLFPGFMFRPFISDETDGAAACIRPTDCKLEIGRKTAKISFSELSLNCYKDSSGLSLVKNAKELFSGDKPVNDDIAAEIYEVDVYDMREYFEKVSFKEGDALVFTVEDYFAGKLKFRRLSNEDRFADMDKATRSLGAITHNIEEFVNAEWFDSDIYTQLSNTFIENPGMLINPLFAFNEVLLLLKKFIILDNHEGRPVIWMTGRPIPKKLRAQEEDEQSIF